MSEENLQTRTSGNGNASQLSNLKIDGETVVDWLTALIESAEDAIISKTLDGFITSWNQGAERIFGYRADEILGKSVLTLIPPALHNEESEIINKIKAGERVEHYETLRVGKNGELIDISLTVSPIKTPEGKIVGASKIARDITAFKRAKKQRLESEKRLRLIADALPVLISYIDADERYSFVNKGYKEWFGILPEQMVGKTIVEIIGAAAYKAVRPHIETVLSGKKTAFDQLMPYPGGEKFIHVDYVPDFDSENGKIRGFFALVQDVTESKRAEALLRESEERFRNLSDDAPVLIWLNDTEGCYYVNQQYLNFLGLKDITDVRGIDWAQFIHPDDRDNYVNAYFQAFEKREKFLAQFRFRRQDGEYRWMTSTGTPRFSQTGEFLGYAGSTVEIDDVKRTEEALRESEARLRIATEAANIFVWESDYRTQKISWSENTSQFIGDASGNLPADVKNSMFFVAPEDRDQLRKEYELAFNSGKDSYVVEFRGFNRAGEIRNWLAQSTIIRDENGAKERVIGATQDITERKRRELDRQFLLEFGEKIRYGDLNPAELLSDVTRSVSEHLDAARCLFIEINETENRGAIKHEHCRKGVASVAGVYKISDYSPETLEEIRSGRTIVNCDAERDPRTAEIYQKTYAPYDERAYISIPLFTDGNWTAIFWISDDKPRRWTKQEISFLETVGERTWFAIEKLRNEQALRQSNERLKMAMDAARIYSWEMNPATGEIVWSENIERVIGFALPKDFGATVNDFIHPDDRDMTSKKILRAINSGDNFAAEFRLVNPETEEIIWLRGQGVLVTDATENQTRFVGITQNITERKQAEQERENLLVREQIARQQAEVASRLKDEFLATVSHELRTPLNAILGWAQMLVSGKFGEEDTTRAIETIYRNAKSQAQLIEDILDVSRIITGKIRLEPKPVSLAPLIQTAVESLRPAIEAKNLKLQMRLDFDPRMVQADPNRLQQVIWNLLSNAVKFTPEKGVITVALESDEANTKIIVSDTGKGISADFLPFVFERFRQADGSSTRSHGGLGLGLAIVRHIVELHGGRIEAFSAGEGAGSTFTVTLPLKQAPADVDETNQANLSANKKSSADGAELERKLKGLRVLLVDDEKDALELLAVVLTQNGVEIKTSTNAQDALETLNAWQPDVIVSDIAMPGEDGYALIEKIRKLPPEKGGAIPVIAVTAYVGIKERTQVLSSGFQMYVPKPVEPSELLGALSNFVKPNL